MSVVKVFKKGESLFKEGEKAQFIYLIQSGSVSLALNRQKQTIELCVLSTNNIAGEHALAGIATHPHSATAVIETKAFEFPIETLKAQLESSGQVPKLLAKATTEKLKTVMKELQSLKLERDNTPCPVDQTAKIFATLFHVSKTKGEAKPDGTITVPFPMAKQYGQRMFLESPKRFEMACNIFVKLGWAKYQMVKNEDEPDAPEEIGFVHFSNLAGVEQFFEYFQYYYFKGGKSDLLKTEDRAIQIVDTILEMATDGKTDRRGIVSLDYTKLIEKVKADLGFQLNSDHFSMLESKGLFAKRQAAPGGDGVVLQFELPEFDRVREVWKVLREVERWNEKGSVDPNEPVADIKKQVRAGAHSCPKCSNAFDGAPKFCPECGHKLALAA